MANINFYLKPGKLNKNGEKSLIMRITFGNDRTMIFLNKMVKPKHWSSKHVVKAPGKNEPDNNYENINKAIITYRNKAEEALRHAVENSIVLSDKYFKSWFTNDDIDKTLRNKNFFELFDLYLEAIKPDRAAQTIRGYKTVRNYLEDFEKESYKFINIKAIDINFFDALKNMP